MNTRMPRRSTIAICLAGILIILVMCVETVALSVTFGPNPIKKGECTNITFVVLDSNNRPVRHAKVIIRGVVGTTGNTGIASVTYCGTAVGTVPVIVTHPDHRPFNGTLIVSDDKSIKAQINLNVNPIEMGKLIFPENREDFALVSRAITLPTGEEVAPPLLEMKYEIRFFETDPLTGLTPFIFTDVVLVMEAIEGLVPGLEDTGRINERYQYGQGFYIAETDTYVGFLVTTMVSEEAGTLFVLKTGFLIEPALEGEYSHRLVATTIMIPVYGYREQL